MTPSQQSEPSEIISWAITAFPDLVVTTGLNLSGTVLIDLASKAGYQGQVVFVDTGFHFSETLELWDRMERRYTSIRFVKLRSVEKTGELFQSDPIRCCKINKIAPLENYLSVRKPSALLNARTQESSISRRELSVVEDGDPIHINPLATLTRGTLERYAEMNSLEIHPLYKDGFLSMGCWPCTKAVRPGEDPRSGRFDGQGRTECGLWGTVGRASETNLRPVAVTPSGPTVKTHIGKIELQNQELKIANE